MTNKIFLTGLGTVLLSSTTAYAACTTMPTCASLGYDKTSCSSDFAVLKCPFDTTKLACVMPAPDCTGFNATSTAGCNTYETCGKKYKCTSCKTGYKFNSTTNTCSELKVGDCTGVLDSSVNAYMPAVVFQVTSDYIKVVSAVNIGKYEEERVCVGSNCTPYSIPSALYPTDPATSTEDSLSTFRTHPGEGRAAERIKLMGSGWMLPSYYDLTQIRAQASKINSACSMSAETQRRFCPVYDCSNFETSMPYWTNSLCGVQEFATNEYHPKIYTTANTSGGMPMCMAMTGTSFPARAVYYIAR